MEKQHKVQCYAAPLEGITGYIYRNAHQHIFQGVDKYFTPFVTPKPKKGLNTREKNDIAPEHNKNIPVVPQILTNKAADFIKVAGMMEELGYKTEPMYNEERADIVQNIEFGNPDDLIKYCQGIQMGSPVDSNSVAEPWDMPGYADKIIMAAGAFTQGSSIELSCDGPIRPPYIAFQQGGLTYQYGKLGVLKAVDNLLKNK